MSVNVGDRIRMHSNVVDVPDRLGTIVAVLGSDGPPYRVRFDAGEETIVTPGPDAVIEPGAVGDRLGLAAEQAGERASEVAGQAAQAAGEAAQAAKETAEKATGTAARVVSDVADAVAKRFEH